MRKRIRCPWHEDSTASLIQYGDFWQCFGACHKRFTNKEVEERTGSRYEYETEDDEREDVRERIQYIQSLKRTNIRGLGLPADEKGYFIVWPDQSFYKYRLFSPGKGSKYLGPKGVKPPLFNWRMYGGSTLYITEGEINCMSVALALPEYDHCSPGSASMFNSDNLTKYLPVFKKYSNLVVILDKDAAGTKGLIESKAFFFGRVPFVKYLQISPDANEILVEYGKDELRQRLLGADYK